MGSILFGKEMGVEKGNLCGLEPQLIKLEFIIYLPKLKVSRACRPSSARKMATFCNVLGASHPNHGALHPALNSFILF